MSTPVKLLIFDGSKEDAELAILALRHGGFDPDYRVIQEPGALESALNTETWEAVLSDFMGAGSGGIEALRMVRRLAGDVPFIFVSGAADEEVAVAAMKAGARDCVMKGDLARLAPALHRELRDARTRIDQRRSHQALAQSERRYRELFEGNPLPQWVFDPVSLRFLEVNDVACARYGYSRTEFLAMTVHGIRPREEIATFDTWLEGSAPEKLDAGVWRHRRRDGTVFHAEIVTHEGDFQGGRARHVCAIDVTERLQAQERIAMLSQAIEQSPAATMITDTDGRIEYVNPRFVDVTGYSAEEVMGRNPSMIKSGLTALDTYRDLWSTLKAGRAWHGVIRNRKKSGELYWADELISPLKNASGEIVNFIAVKKDITARLSAEAKLLESESRFRQITENIHEVFWLTDFSKSQMLYVSPAYEEIWGRSVASLHASPGDWIDAIHADDRERVLQALRGQAGGEYAEEYRILRPDGELRWIRDRAFPIATAAGEVYRVAGVAEDITDQRRAEHQLRESESKLRTVVEMAPVGIFVVDRRGRILEANRMGAQLLGHSREDLLQLDIADFAAREDAHQIPQAIARALEGGHVHSNCEILRKDGTAFPGGISAIALPDGSLLAIVRDMSDQKRATDASRELHDIERRRSADLELRVAQRTAELEFANTELQAFAHSVSHDLRAPLNRIQGFSAMLLEEGDVKRDERACDLLRRVGKAGRDMENLIGDLLELSKVTAGELRRTKVNISAIITESLGKLRNAEPARAVAISVESGMSASGDSGLLRIVFDNLLGNAWKFTAKRDIARIEAGWTGEPGDPPVFFVRDNGAGFDMSGISKLFTPFQRLHGKGEFDGTGIGLATVQRVVRRHGGRIWAEGEVGRGATFCFTLAPAVAAR